MKGVFSAIALAAIGVGCGAAGDPTHDFTTSDTTSEEIRSGRHKKIIEVVEQHNLVSDADPPNPADFHDERLVNAWGLAFSPIGSGWVSAAETGISFVFRGDGSTIFTVTIPTRDGVPPASPPSNPTGQVFNPMNGPSGDFDGDAFIFVTEGGEVAGWQSGTLAALRFAADDGAIYKGVAIAETRKGRRLYATDFHNNKIDVFDSDYNLVKRRHDFEDKDIPCDFAPFNVFTYKNLLFVSYAKQDAQREDDVAGPGNGFVDVFDANGRLLERLISKGELNSPWGMAVAPDDFGRASNKLLVGNFGDGRINAYDLSMHGFKLRAKFAGQLGTSEHRPLVIDGLWAVAFGLGNGFDTDEIYFTAGPSKEEHGIFGELEIAEEK